MRIAQLARHASVLVNDDGQAGFGPGGGLVSTPLHVMTLTFLIIRWSFLKMRVRQISTVYLSPSQEVRFLEALKCCAGEFENKTQQIPKPLEALDSHTSKLSTKLLHTPHHARKGEVCPNCSYQLEETTLRTRIRKCKERS